jgi:hypothetical protein
MDVMNKTAHYRGYEKIPAHWSFWPPLKMQLSIISVKKRYQMMYNCLEHNQRIQNH